MNMKIAATPWTVAGVAIPVLLMAILSTSPSWRNQLLQHLKPTPTTVTHFSAAEEIVVVTAVAPHGTGATVSVASRDGVRRYALNVTGEIGESRDPSGMVSLKEGDLLIVQERYLASPDGPFMVYKTAAHDGVIQSPR